MDEHSIERIRNANFSSSVMGYDRAEVDRFLSELADWLETGEGEDVAAVEAVRVELQRVGEQTASILTEAHAAAQAIREQAAADTRKQLVDANLTAEALRGEAGDYAGDARDEADAYARKIRSEADVYADQTRSETDTETQDERQAAQKESERIVSDATARKAEIEKVITDLERRRDAVLVELDRLASGIAGTATEHRGPAPEPVAESETESADETDETAVLARDAE